ncbi:uncharacterized protein C6orf132-like [Panicum hallii]|uniref:uncharacterized protein C6orf132-like n=1 Tax=Panicum hallii TaxID=206008 RepID=UPI000DF4DECD|nr:uncharacterized protein C6orf132-like [Panicum hallii]
MGAVAPPQFRPSTQWPAQPASQPPDAPPLPPAPALRPGAPPSLLTRRLCLQLQPSAQAPLAPSLRLADSLSQSPLVPLPAPSRLAGSGLWALAAWPCPCPCWPHPAPRQPRPGGQASRAPSPRRLAAPAVCAPASKRCRAGAVPASLPCVLAHELVTVLQPQQATTARKNRSLRRSAPLPLRQINRSFSAMNIIKRELRNKIEDDWMNDLMVCYTEKEIFKSLDDEIIIRRFQRLKTRRMQLPRSSRT